MQLINKSSILFALIMGVSIQIQAQSDSTWEVIFNGENLTGWTPVFQGYDVGENPGEIFRVEDETLTVTYEGLGGSASTAALGNIWYEKEYSYYLLSMEYMIWGEMASGAVGWGRENSGIMLHVQSAESMGKDQNFPLSLEMQIVGPNTSGIGGNPKKTGNLCTLGNDVIFEGSNNYSGSHCTASTVDAVPLDEWVRAKALVLGDSVIQHIINDEVAIAYTKPKVVNENMISNATADKVSDYESPMTSGYIALQSEGHPFRFRNIKVLNLVGCMDESAVNYRDYYVKHDEDVCEAGIPGCMDSTYHEYDSNANIHDALACQNAGIEDLDSFKGIRFDKTQLTVSIPVMGHHKIEIYDVAGNRVYVNEGKTPGIYSFVDKLNQGVYVATVRWNGKLVSEKFIRY